MGHDRMFREYVRRFGFSACVRMCKNLGIAFEDAYFMAFGRLPREVQR